MSEKGSEKEDKKEEKSRVPSDPFEDEMETQRGRETETETDQVFMSTTAQRSDPRLYMQYPNSVFTNPPSLMNPVAGAEQDFEPYVGDNIHDSRALQHFGEGQPQQASYRAPIYNYQLVPQIVGVPISNQAYYGIGNGQHFLGRNELGQPFIMMPASPISSNSALSRSTMSMRSSTTESTESNPSTSEHPGSSRLRRRHWQKQTEGPPGANLFIYHLPLEVTDAELLTLFDPWGEVLSVRVFVDKDSNLSKGFGFVSYATPEMAQTAIKNMNRYRVGNKRLKVAVKR